MQSSCKQKTTVPRLGDLEPCLRKCLQWVLFLGIYQPASTLGYQNSIQMLKTNEKGNITRNIRS